MCIPGICVYQAGYLWCKRVDFGGDPRHSALREQGSSMVGSL